MPCGLRRNMRRRPPRWWRERWTRDAAGAGAFAELLAESERAARALLGRFAPGERVAVWANNLPEWVILELAAGLAGITVVTVNPALRPRELAYVLGQSRADGIFLVPTYRASRMAEMRRAGARRAPCAAGGRLVRTTGRRSAPRPRRTGRCRR